MVRLILPTVAGLEYVAAAELRRCGVHATSASHGFVVLEVDGQELPARIAQLNATLRCFERVGVLLADFETTSLAGISPVVRDLDLASRLDATTTLAVRGSRRGTHDYTSQQLAGEVGAEIIDRLQRQTGHSMAVDLRTPQTIVRADQRDARLVLWLDTTGAASLDQRVYRAYNHMASMRPSVANLLLELAEIDRAARTLLVDPFCGSATILIEAARRWPDPTMALVGIERFSGHLQGAVENVARAGLSGRIRLHAGLAQATDSAIGAAAADQRRVVVTNPPFGRRVGSSRSVEHVYRDAAASWSRAEVETVVTIAERARPMDDALAGAGYRVEKRLPVIYGRSPVTVFRARRAT